MPTQEIQRDPITTEDLTPYRGRWVAIENGHAIADALDANELRDLPRGTGGVDTYLIFIPSGDSNTLLL